MRLPGATVLVALALAGCGPGASEGTTFHATDVTGTWDVYRTYAGEPERGPDAASFQNVASGYGVGVHFECSSHVLPAGHLNVAGEVRGARLTLAAPDATYAGTVTGASMDGEFAESVGRSGTWRARKVAAAKCRTYEVWGGSTSLACGPGGSVYAPEANGYTLLGTGTATATFVGTFSHYLVTTRDLNQLQIDAVETTPGTFLSPTCTENLSSSPGTLASIDGTGYVIGNGAMSQGGALPFDPSTTPTSIKVYVVP